MAQQVYDIRRSGFRAWRLSFKAALTLIKVNLQQQLTYQDEVWNGLLQMSALASSVCSAFRRF